jgi:pimeloyl-ACP methyl ester carboxylesterase
MSIEPQHGMVETNGVQLHVAESGPRDGPPLILLHGFPETWRCWRHQIEPLAEAGYRVMAPDQRGYGRSARPRSTASYAIDLLVADVLGLIESSGWPKASVVGHDWGGVVAWWLAIRHPDRLERLAIMNAPHPVAFTRTLWSSPRQFLKSWYAFFFQLPWLPELVLRLGHWRLLTRVLRQSSRPGAFTEEDLEDYRRAWSEPGAITAMVDWYRAALRHRPPLPDDPRIKVPTLLLWGTNDRFLDRRLASASLELCETGSLVFFEEATHWLQHEESDQVNRRLLDFLRGESAQPRHPAG